MIPVTDPEAAGSGHGMHLGHGVGEAAQESRSGTFPMRALGYSVVIQSFLPEFLSAWRKLGQLFPPPAPPCFHCLF